MIIPSLYTLKWLLIAKGSLSLVSTAYNLLEILYLTKSTVKMLSYPFEYFSNKESNQIEEMKPLNLNKS